MRPSLPRVSFSSPVRHSRQPLLLSPQSATTSSSSNAWATCLQTLERWEGRERLLYGRTGVARLSRSLSCHRILFDVLRAAFESTLRPLAVVRGLEDPPSSSTALCFSPSSRWPQERRLALLRLRLRLPRPALRPAECLQLPPHPHRILGIPSPSPTSCPACRSSSSPSSFLALPRAA